MGYATIETILDIYTEVTHDKNLLNEGDYQGFYVNSWGIPSMLSYKQLGGI